MKLSVIEGPHLGYDVRVRLPLGGVLDLTVPADKVGRPDFRQ
jgi:hypothetical protein